MSTINKFLIRASFPESLESLLTVIDMDGNLSMIHYTEEGKDDTLARIVRGWVYDHVNDVIIVKGEQDFEDVKLTDELLDSLQQEYLCFGRQTTHVRLYAYQGKVQCCTHKKLDAFKSFWGVGDMKVGDQWLNTYGKSFGNMLLSASNGKTLQQLHDEHRYNDNGCIDLFIECEDNQLVVNTSIGEVTKATLYDRADLLQFNLEHRSDGEVDLDYDVCLIDYHAMKRYYSPSLYTKLFTVRNPNEPNILRRFFVLKGSGRKLIHAIPSKQRAILQYYENKKREMVNTLLTKLPINEDIIKFAKMHNVTNNDAFFRLPGIQQYRMLFGEDVVA